MRYIVFSLFLVLTAACGGDPSETPARERGQQASSGSDFTAFELEHGIGPITEEVILAPIDPALAERGATIYNMKCASCHLMTDRFVGPPLGNVTEQRSPAFIMNFILNPSDMARRHPEGRKLLAEYLTPMPFQNVSEEDARALLEYLRVQAEKH